MKEQLAALYELQRLDVQLASVRSALDALNGAKALRMQLEAARAKEAEAEKILHDRETELRDSELKLKSIDEKRGSYEKRLYSGTVSNPKELAAMQKEITMLKTQQGDLDGRTLDLYEQVESAREQAKAARESAAKVDAALAEALAAESEQKSKLDVELADLTARREAEAAKISDKSLLSRYEAVLKKTGNTGIAKVVEGRCEGCRVSVTNFTKRKLFEDKDPERCENCGRILFMEFK